MGKVNSAAECQSLCSNHGVYVWSSNTGHCWTRTDNTWAPISQNGILSGCNDQIVTQCSSKPPYNGPISVSADLTSPAGMTHPLSPAVTFDFWKPDDPNFGKKWGNSSANYIDLQNPQLLALTKALSPGLLRLGGSPEDSLIFNADGKCIPGSGGNGPFPGYYCSQVHPYSYDCLSPTRWNDLLQFAQKTNFKIVFLFSKIIPILAIRFLGD